MAKNTFEQFIPTLTASAAPVVRDPRLLMAEDGDIRVYYAPFEYINPTAKIALVGITPGPSQMVNANTAARAALLAGSAAAEAMKMAKATAAFSGKTMRDNLSRQLNHWGVQDWLGIPDASDLFGASAHLVHTTSLLRFPVFVAGDDYRGTPDMTRQPLLRELLIEHFVDEVKRLPDAVFFGLGPAVQRVLEYLVAQGHLSADRVIGGMLHPSPNCTYRIDYLVNNRAAPVPHATNVTPYDNGRAAFAAKYLGNRKRAASPTQTSAPTCPNQRETPPVKTLKKLAGALSKPSEHVSLTAQSNASIAMAEAVLSRRLDRTATPSQYIAGFQSRAGRQIALVRNQDTVSIFTEATGLHVPQRFQALRTEYAAMKSRHSGLNTKHASRLVLGKPVDYWKLPDAATLEAFLDWYAV